MTKRPKIPEFMGVSEACEELGVFPSNLDKLVGLPKPAFRLRAGRFWYAAEIKEFAEQRAEKAKPD